MKSIYRKLKDYICVAEYGSTYIFGNLKSRDCVYCYKNNNGEWVEQRGVGIYAGELDFLLDYYVVGIHPEYEIVKNAIKPYLQITLHKEKPEL